MRRHTMWVCYMLFTMHVIGGSYAPMVRFSQD